jgi:hypothetical protein
MGLLLAVLMALKKVSLLVGLKE